VTTASGATKLRSPLTKLHRLSYCPECLKKQQEIDRLREELVRLKAKLRYEQRNAQEGFFGSSTPSAKRPVKPNTGPPGSGSRGGAKPGHRGHGRRRLPPQEVTRKETLVAPDRCPTCGGALRHKGAKPRTVIDVHPIRKEVIRYQVQRKRCGGCQRTVAAHVPGVFAKGLFGTQLLAHVAREHYVHGVTLGHLAAQLGIGRGSLWTGLHQLARRLETVPEQLLQDYRQAPVKHADETGWRTDGRNGYAWLFCTPTLSLFRFRQSRSAQVAQQVFGPAPLPGTLVVDRYNGYNQAPCPLQYCYSHLLREVQDLGKEFPDELEIQRFVPPFAALLAQAIQLRGAGLTRQEFLRQAGQIKEQIQAAAQQPAQHPGLQKIQNLFREKAHRLYRWAQSPEIPADNNRAERELRPLVIARKISFGSQSEQGAKTREILMTVLHTLGKRTKDLLGRFKRALDSLAEDETQDPYKLLFDPDSS